MARSTKTLAGWFLVGASIASSYTKKLLNGYKKKGLIDAINPAAK